MSRLVFLHGFTQTHHHWHGPAHAIAQQLPGQHTLSFVDLPGHGLAADDRTKLTSAGEALAGLGGEGLWVGYSMGARFALHASLAPDNQIDRLVLIGATPGIEGAAERAERQQLDESRAAAIERDGIEGFVDAWLAMPMFARLPPDERDLTHRRRNDAAGLASSLRLAGTGSQVPLWERLGEIDIPVLVLAGALDPKFVAIGQRMATHLPNGTFVAIADAAHAAHTEQPGAVAAAIRSWANP
ncbi:MAG TPA: alpha/beta fold hydrolase [Ilumatobacter sp.]|nr:alpha/beta fold hydrolase [Ilumatobacter sp.]